MSALLFDCRLRYDSGFTLDARFDVPCGVCGLVGPSGSGKTTILHLIAGILRPDEGKIRLGSEVLVDSHAGRFLPPQRRRVGIVFQDHLLFPHMTVRANLVFGKDRPGSRAMALDRVTDVLDIGDLLDRYPATLSGGQKQRAALARALLRGPDLLLLDEPLAGLDAALKERILGYLERVISEWHLPTLLVSHDGDDVRRLADTIIVLEQGRVESVMPSPSA